jgi:hypothetical protein
VDQASKVSARVSVAPASVPPRSRQQEESIPPSLRAPKSVR